MNYKYLGELNNIATIANKNKVDEVIITDTNLPTSTIMKLMANSNNKTKFHIIPEYDELVTSRIITDISDSISDDFKYNLNKPRFRFIKRFSDIILSVFILTVGFPALLLMKNCGKNVRKWFEILIGKKTVIGIYEVMVNDKCLVVNDCQNQDVKDNKDVELNNYHLSNSGSDNSINHYKVGLIGLAHINQTGELSDISIAKLNEYYLKNYSIWLDIEILIKYFLRIR